jgi:phosphoglycerol transferase MdoB-like AlkP superfamily enzyme
MKSALTVRAISSLFLLIIAYAMLIPGLTEPVLHIVTTLDKAELAALGKGAIIQNIELPDFLLPMATELINSVQVNGTVVIHDSAKSILATSQALWNDGNHLVAVLIITFSVVVPALKLLLMVLSTLWRNSMFGWRLKRISSAMSKWSMADVFAVAMLISFLAIKSTEGTSALVENQISLEIGFYYFIGFCLLSILASQLMVAGVKPNNTVRPECVEG